MNCKVSVMGELFAKYSIGITKFEIIFSECSVINQHYLRDKCQPQKYNNLTQDQQTTLMSH